MTRAVIGPLRDGLSSLTCLYDCLLRVNLPSHGLAGSGDLRGLIVRAERDLRRASEEAGGGLRQMDQDTENLTAQQNTTNREREEKKLSLNNLRLKLHAENQSLESSKEALEQARGRLRHAKTVLEKQRDRQATAAVLTGVGLALTPIPLFGQAAELVLLGAAGKLTCR